MKKIIAFALITIMSLSIMVGCGKQESGDKTSSVASKKAESGQLTTVYNNVMKVIFSDNEPALAKQEDAALIEDLFGLKPEMMKEHYIAIPMINVSVDTFIGIEAAEGQVKVVEDTLNAYKDKIIQDKIAFPYLPDHLPKAKAAQVITIDDYVFYISLGVVGEDVNENNMQEAMNNEVQKAVDEVKHTLKNDK